MYSSSFTYSDSSRLSETQRNSTGIGFEIISMWIKGARCGPYSRTTGSIDDHLHPRSLFNIEQTKDFRPGSVSSCATERDVYGDHSCKRTLIRALRTRRPLLPHSTSGMRQDDSIFFTSFDWYSPDVAPTAPLGLSCERVPLSRDQPE